MLNAITQQKYYDSKPGEYLCECITCKAQFFGDKRDSVCPSCERNVALKLTRENVTLTASNTALALDNARLREVLRYAIDSEKHGNLSFREPSITSKILQQALSQSPTQSVEVLDRAIKTLDGAAILARTAFKDKWILHDELPALFQKALTDLQSLRGGG